MICGPAGVGKTIVASELSALLSAANVPHALIDTDELDRVHPWPPPGWRTSELSRRNLESIWANYLLLGHERLIVTGVFTDIEAELAWIGQAVTAREISVFRLRAEPSELEARVRRREIGSGAEDQLRRIREQVRSTDDPPWVIDVDTSGLDVPTTAKALLRELGWLTSARV